MIAVIGCGNPNRSDDGVGPHIIAQLRARQVERDGVSLFDAGTDGMAAMFAARGCHTLIIVDACRSGSTPGAIFEVPGAELERPYAAALNLHDFRWDNALHAGRMIFRDQFPTDIAVLLIEAESVGLGLGLTPTVTTAAAVVITRIEALIAARSRRDGGASVSLRHGGLYLGRDVFDRYFAGLEAVILLRRDNDLLILPVRHAAAGGYLLKRRNAAGDRVVNAPDFFREHGLGDEVELDLAVDWSTRSAGLVAADAFRLQI